MSRKISAKTSVTMTKEEQALMQTTDGKLLFTEYQGKECALLLQNDRLIAATFFTKTPSKIGAIYIGKVKNVAKNIDACFVEIADEEVCFLPLNKATSPFILNRKYDCRILEGDELPVQIERDAQKGKQASVTAHISLSNDYFAFALGNTKAGFSTKLSKNCKDIASEIFTKAGILENGCLVQDFSKWRPSSVMIPSSTRLSTAISNTAVASTGIVFRTKVGELVEREAELMAHFYSLSAEFFNLLHIAAHRSCFSCLKEAPEDFEAVIQQFDFNEYTEFVTDKESRYHQLKKYCTEHKINKQIRLYQDKLLTLSSLYSLESKLEMALERRVWLKSGGYLIIEPTEALTVIDVNSGKYEAKKDIAETYRKINLEAAKEIAIQLRLRNLSGIILVDFINMQSTKDKAELLEFLKGLVKQDKVKTTIVDMTPLGLVEITRKKINKPLLEQFMKG